MMKLDPRKRIDLLYAAPLIVFYLRSVVINLSSVRDLSRDMMVNGANNLSIVQTLSSLTAVAFGALLVGLLLVRMPPVGTAHGIVPRVLAVVGTFLALGFGYLPPAALSLSMAMFAVLLVLTGMALTAYALFYLGRSFSIVPEARKLVTSGPYRLVRHPVYLFEEIAVFGLALQFAAPWSTILLLVHAVIQFARLHYEEQVLRANFPEYTAYAARTARLFPGIY